ncbi:MAG: transposase [Pseudomonadota bacterium]|nr:transposase [Pseudomonadota bacterium]
MKTDESGLPRRKSVRLRHYDYREPAAFFVTLCTAERRCLFGHVANHDMHPSRLGCLVRSVWGRSGEHTPHVLWHDMVVMPNHVHGVLQIVTPAQAATREGFGMPVAGSLSSLMRSFKAAVTLEARKRSLIGPEPLWQGRYYEHLIRCEADYLRIVEYMANNPRQWAEDRFYVRQG